MRIIPVLHLLDVKCEHIFYHVWLITYLTRPSFVCAATKDKLDVRQLRSYAVPREPPNSVTIREAALATCAGPGMFKTARVGDMELVDVALGANNPIEQVKMESSRLWSHRSEIWSLVQCIISVGTGVRHRRGPTIMCSTSPGHWLAS